MNVIQSTVRQMRILHGVLLVSMVLYAALGEKLGPAERRELKIIPLALAVQALLCLGIALFFQARMVRAAAEALCLRPEETQPLQRWRTGNIISFLLCEAAALFGLVLRMLGGTFLGSAPFYAVAILLMLLWVPRLDVSGQS